MAQHGVDVRLGHGMVDDPDLCLVRVQHVEGRFGRVEAGGGGDVLEG
ncbi:hypothetical protein ACFYPZ_40020 [Streptomyces sp. NPDC005506]